MSSMNQDKFLTEFYALIAELWCGPPVTDAVNEKLQKDAEKIVAKLQSFDKEAATLLSSFLAENAIAEEDYIDL